MRATIRAVDPLPHPQEWDSLSREQLIDLLATARAEIEDHGWVHRASDDFEGCTE